MGLVFEEMERKVGGEGEDEEKEEEGVECRGDSGGPRWGCGGCLRGLSRSVGGGECGGLWGLGGGGARFGDYLWCGVINFPCGWCLSGVSSGVSW